MKTQINEIKRMQLLAGVINESQLNEGWDDFNATGWMARIKDLAKEMGYDASTGWDDQNTDRARLKAADEAKKGEKKAYIGTVDDGNTIVVTFTLDIIVFITYKYFIIPTTIIIIIGITIILVYIIIIIIIRIIIIIVIIIIIIITCSCTSV